MKKAAFILFCFIILQGCLPLYPTFNNSFIFDKDQDKIKESISLNNVILNSIYTPPNEIDSIKKSLILNLHNAGFTSIANHSDSYSLYIDVIISEKKFTKNFRSFSSYSVDMILYDKSDQNEIKEIGMANYSEESLSSISSFSYLNSLLNRAARYLSFKIP